MSQINKTFYSPIVTVGTTIDLAIEAEYKELSAGCQYFTDATGTTEVAPGAGTVTLTAKAAVTNQFTAISGGALDATDVTAQALWVGNSSVVKAVPAGITTATHYRLNVLGTN